MSDDEAPMVAATAAVAGGAEDDGEGLASTPKLPDGESGSDDGREVNFDQSDEEDNSQSKKARSGATERKRGVKSSPGGPSKPSKRQNEEREARDEFVKRLASEMQTALLKDTKAREEHRPAFEMLKMLPRVCEAVANPLLFNYWRDDSAHMNLLADWITPHSRSVNLPILTKLLPAIEQLPLEKDDISDYHRLPKSLSNVEALLKEQSGFSSLLPVVRRVLAKWKALFGPSAAAFSAKVAIVPPVVPERSSIASDAEQQKLKPGDVGYRYSATRMSEIPIGFERAPTFDERKFTQKDKGSDPLAAIKSIISKKSRK